MSIALIFATAPDDIAPALAKTLLQEGLIACGNIVAGARSVYRWENEMVDTRESMLWMETTHACVNQATARLVALHPYACPKILTFSSDTAHPPYAAWVDQSVSRPVSLPRP